MIKLPPKEILVFMELEAKSIQNYKKSYHPIDLNTAKYYRQKINGMYHDLTRIVRFK